MVQLSLPPHKPGQSLTRFRQIAGQQIAPKIRQVGREHVVITLELAVYAGYVICRVVQIPLSLAIGKTQLFTESRRGDDYAANLV